MLAARFRRSHPFWLLLEGKIPRVLLGHAGCSAGILEADNEVGIRLHGGCMSGCHSRNWSSVTHATEQKDRTVGRQACCSRALPLPDRDSSRNGRMIDAMLKASSKTCRRDAGVVALLQGEDRSVGYGVMTLGSRRHVPIGATRRRGIQIAPFRRLFEKALSSQMRHLVARFRGLLTPVGCPRMPQDMNTVEQEESIRAPSSRKLANFHRARVSRTLANQIRGGLPDVDGCQDGQQR